MWHYLTNKVFADNEIDMETSFYCGDCAGRPPFPERNMRGDVNDRDYKFT